MSTPSTPRPSVIQLAIKEKAALYAAYIPLFSDGGVFIPTTREYKLGDDVYVLLSLPVALAVALSYINPGHMDLLFKEHMGQMMILGAIVMQTIGYIWIRKVIKIEV